jgi:type II secretory pathway pseudopilin PulG
MNKRGNRYNKVGTGKIAGFTLVEIAILTVIIGVFVALSLSAGWMQYRIEQVNNGWSELKQIRKSLHFYGQMYDRLPCPSSTTLRPDEDGYGSPSTDCIDSTPPLGLKRVDVGGGNYIRIGAVPFHALDLSRELMTDPWGNLYFYAVSEANITALDIDTDGVITIEDGSGNSLTTKASYIIGTHGATSKGAIAQDTQTVLIACDGANLDGENCDFNDGLFYDAPFDEGENAASFFDDYVLWDTRMSVLQ